MPDSDNTITAEGLRALKDELEQLETVGRREIAERIKTAREFGDLKENAEYHDAKNDQALLETRIARLQERMTSAVVAEAGTADGSVAFGSTVAVQDDAGREATYTIVGAAEADASAGRISSESPVARALIGKRPGETATISLPRGDRELKVLRVS